jgi:hypothetical protein
MPHKFLVPVNKEAGVIVAFSICNGFQPPIPAGSLAMIEWIWFP